MNTIFRQSLITVALASLVIPIFQVSAQTTALEPAPVLKVMQRVADWQLAHPETNRPTGWICGVGDIGMMALAGISSDPKYRDAMLALGETNDWSLPQYRGRIYHADDQCIGQVWAELYFQYRENDMIGPMRQKMDFILDNPSPNQSLQWPASDTWSWCDALFMAPPSWVRLYAATDDPRYLDFAVTNFWRTTDFLYDTNSHLFYRDSSALDKHEQNGQKSFWDRGNGWVLAGIARTLQYLPANNPDRPRFEQLFRDMAGAVLASQQPDGLWRSSLLDPQDYPTPEASGSALFTYGLAWGINQGLLDPATYGTAVDKAWTALGDCVDADGKVTHVQPAGSAPALFPAETNAPYGAGTFLLAGSEVYRMALLANTKHIVVKVTNPASFRRDCETVEIAASKIAPGSNPLDMLLTSGKPIAVMDGMSSRILDSQVYSPSDDTNELLFQVDLAPGESRTYEILDASKLPGIPQPIVKTMARYVPERDDDFCWESDRIAHRSYGLALIPAEGTISSGPDVWIKKNHILICDVMYATKHYHYDNGEFMDDYRVGNSRGCGGTGVWDGNQLHVSSNYHTWKLITTGPIRSEFELMYDPWDAGNGGKISEVKRISIDANSFFSKDQSTFTSDKWPLTLAVGLAERACGANGTEEITNDQAAGWMSYWQPEDKPKGRIGTAIVLPRGAVTEFTTDKQDLPDSKIHADVPQPTHEGAPPIRNLLAITTLQQGQPLDFYFGACWDRSGDFTNATEWAAETERLAARRDQPLQVTIGN